MFGRAAFVFVVLAAVAGAVCWFVFRGPEPPASGPGPAAVFEYGLPLYPPDEHPADTAPAAPPPGATEFPDFTIRSVEVSNVPALAEGKILFIGTQVSEKDLGKYPRDEIRKVEVDRGGEKEPYYYRRLKETDKVVENQMLGMINPAKAFDKLDIARANLEVAKSDALAAESTYETAREEMKRAERGNLSRPPSVSASELAISRLQAEKSYREMLAKRSKVEAAQSDVYSAATEASWYVIRNPLPGVSVIKSIDKHAGDAAKNLETVLELQNDSLLRAEGMVDVAYLSRLLAMKGTKVRVEPTYEEPPLRVLVGHRKEVTSVAVGQDAAGPVIISGSLDRSVAVWDAATGAMRTDPLPHPDAVRVVAAAPRGSAKNWFLSTGADGSVRLWDLDHLNSRPVVLSGNPHTDAVTALAFSPDGRYFATGGADNLICLWRTADARLLYKLDAEHGVDNAPQGQVTALTITPQGRLIAAGRDNALRVWELCEHGARPVATIGDRSGTVARLGVSADGRHMLFDQGKTLQILAVPRGRTEAWLQKPSSAQPFETLALFSPDGKLILTAGAAEGRLQLWSTPTAASRAFEVRVLSSADRAGVTCAAFAPKGVAVQGREIAVSGTREGRVLVWALPTAQEIGEAPVAGTLTMVDTALEPGARQARIGVEIDNARGRLNPGKQATVVITP